MLRSTLLAAAPIRRAAATLCSPLLGSILLALLVSACDSSAGKETTAAAPERPVLVASVAYQNVNQTRSLAATIRPRVESDLGFRVTGKVAQRLIQNGDRVRKGQPLFRIRPDEVFVEQDPAERERRLRASTEAYLERLG